MECTSRRAALRLQSLMRCWKSRLSAFGYDVENAKTIVSFGAPILDGWGTPGRVMAAFNRKRERTEKGFHLIQIETRYSRTAALADSWIPINPGTELPFALGLANVIITEKLYDREKIRRLAIDFTDFQHFVKYFTPDVAEKITGVQCRHNCRYCTRDSTTKTVAGCR